MDEQQPGPAVSRDVDAPAEAVWRVLADGWSYPTWVVGASRVRDVDTGWPEVGTRIHHAFGPWPAVIQDYTVAEEMTPERRLVLKARGWPVGEARVVITIEPTGPERCRVTMAEDAINGPGALVPHPLRQVLILPRNRESLYRVALLAEGQYRKGELKES